LAFPGTDTLPAPTAAPGDRAWRHLLRAFLWLVAAVFASVCGVVVVAFVAGVSRGYAHAHGGTGWTPGPLDEALAGTIALQATLLFADLKQGRSVGRGDLVNGLGAGPMRRHGLIAAFAGLMLVWVAVYVAIIVHVPAVSAYLAPRLPSVLALQMSASPIVLATHVLLLVIVAPVAEELFFRGWLWTALRRTWGVWPTAVCTAAVWLAVHTLDGPIRAVILVPTAVLLCLARHYGGSVRASLLVHLVNNGAAVMIQVAAVVFASG
jgi:membrane protease YdiL (CAAX protease family)